MCIRDRVNTPALSSGAAGEICPTHAEHALANTHHCIHSVETKILSSVSDYYPRLHPQSIEIYKHSSATKNRRGESLLLFYS